MALEYTGNYKLHPIVIMCLCTQTPPGVDELLNLLQFCHNKWKHEANEALAPSWNCVTKSVTYVTVCGVGVHTASGGVRPFRVGWMNPRSWKDAPKWGASSLAWHCCQVKSIVRECVEKNSRVYCICVVYVCLCYAFIAYVLVVVGTRAAMTHDCYLHDTQMIYNFSQGVNASHVRKPNKLMILGSTKGGLRGFDTRGIVAPDCVFLCTQT